MSLRWGISLLATTMSFFACNGSWSHPGGTDEEGCHRDSRTGGRHCHAKKTYSERARSDHPARDQQGFGDFHGKLGRVIDGDGLFAVIDGRNVEVRLADIDSPEWDQPYGGHAKLELLELTQGRDLDLKCRGRDPHKRWLCRIWADDLDVNRELVARGASWVYEQYSQDPSLKEVERAARTTRLGLWGDGKSDPLPPWKWKRGVRR